METSAAILWVIFAIILMIGSMLSSYDEHFAWWGPGWRCSYGWCGYPGWRRPYWRRRMMGCYGDCPRYRYGYGEPM